MRELEANRSGVELVGQGLIEAELWDGLALGGIEARRLVEEEVSLGRAACGRDGWRPIGQLEVQEDGSDGGRVGEWMRK